MPFEIQQLGERTNVDVIASFVELESLTVLDVGCGNMEFTRQIAETAHRVLAIDPDPVQAKANRDGECPGNIEFVETDAQTIPAADDSMDGVFFAYSLHHLDMSTYGEIFAEIFRVLKAGGFIYAIEPVDCPLNQVMRLFHDEEVVRQAAQDWLETIADRFGSVHAVEYYGHTQYQSFDDFANKFSAKTFNSIYSESDVRQAHVETAFYENAGEDLIFQSPKRVVLLRNFNKLSNG